MALSANDSADDEDIISQQILTQTKRESVCRALKRTSYDRIPRLSPDMTDPTYPPAATNPETSLTSATHIRTIPSPKVTPSDISTTRQFQSHNTPSTESHNRVTNAPEHRNNAQDFSTRTTVATSTADLQMKTSSPPNSPRVPPLHYASLSDPKVRHRNAPEHPCCSR